MTTDGLAGMFFLRVIYQSPKLFYELLDFCLATRAIAYTVGGMKS